MRRSEKYEKEDADFSLEVLKIRTTMQGAGALTTGSKRAADGLHRSKGG